jgi:ATP-dependent Clp protease ATP-binding subunit ClpC
MSGAGRFLVRVVSYVSLLFLVVAAATLLFFSDIISLQAAGALLFLFLADRARHAGGGDRRIQDLPKEGAVNVGACISSRAFSVVERAFERSGLKRVSVHGELLHDLLGVPEVAAAFERLEVDLGEFRGRLESLVHLPAGRHGPGDAPDSRAERLRKLEALMLLAFAHARDAHHEFIEPSDLFAACTSLEEPALLRLWTTFSLGAREIQGAVFFAELARRASRLGAPTTLGSFAGFIRRGLRHRVMNRAWTARPTPTLDRYSTDFTDLARAGVSGFLVGHAAEMERLVDVLARPLNPNALLVGEAGVGKETLVAHLAWRLTKDEVPPALFDKRLVALDIGQLVAGAPPEELHARLWQLVREIMDAGNVILCIPDIHNLVKTSSAAYLSVADALVPILRDNAFPVIGTTYPREYVASIEPRSDFAGAFEVIRVEEISEEEAVRVLVYAAVLLERQFHVRVTLSALRSAVALAKKYLREKLLPASAEELLKSALANASRRGDKVLRREDVVRALESKVNVPVHEATAAEAEQLLHLEAIIHERMVDQEEAVKAVADALREYRSGLSRKGGPIASFLFVGPTGVGKTELAKNLARVQFGDERAMVRFDMTEYQDAGSIKRFIGSPDGAIDGALTRAVREKPYCVVLLDEFEKAHADILDLFLQVFDDGRLTDGMGRTANFENAILIATSNAHSDIINDSLRQGQPMADIADYLKRRLTDVLKPELVNRFSRIVVFKNLSTADLRKIAALQLKELGRTLEEQGIALEADESAIDLLVRQGYEPAFGARPLRRVLEEKVRAPLSEKILKKEIARGGTLTLTTAGEEFRFAAKE